MIKIFSDLSNNCIIIAMCGILLRSHRMDRQVQTAMPRNVAYTRGMGETYLQMGEFNSLYAVLMFLHILLLRTFFQL